MTTVTVNTDLTIYNELVQTAYLERVQDVIEIFNGNSAGAIQLVNESVEGDYSKQAFYKIGGSIAHRNVNSTDTVNPDNIDSDERIGVKVPWKYGPYGTTEEAFKRRARTIEEFAVLMGQDMADAVLEGQIAYAVAALQGAIGGNAAMMETGSISNDGKKVLTKGMRTLGDRFSRLAIWVMDASVYFDLVDQSITDKIYEEAGVVVYGGQPGTLGKPVLVTDKAPSDKIFGLQPGAIVLKESQPPGVRTYNIDNLENLAIGMRAEGVVNVDVRGYSWDPDTGGSNPDNDALASTDNWDKYATSNKATAGFIIDVSGSSS